MQDNSYLFQKPFSVSTENLSFTAVHNLSPNQQANLKLNSTSSIRSNSDTNIKFSATNGHTPSILSDNMNSSAYLSQLVNNNSSQPDVTTDISGNKIEQHSYIIRLSNLPKDLSEREAYAIFALAVEVKSIELITTEEPHSTTNKKDDFHKVSGPIVEAKFDSLPLALQYSSILNMKPDLFNPEFPCHCKVEVIDSSTNQKILINRESVASQQFPPSPLATKNPRLSLPASSRFSFTDPFSSTDYNQYPPPSSQSQTYGQHPVKSNELSQSFLSLENKDINESIWNSTGMPSSINGFASSSKPATPSMEWGNASSTRSQSVAFFSPTSTHNMAMQNGPPVQSNLGMPPIMPMANVPTLQQQQQQQQQQQEQQQKQQSLSSYNSLSHLNDSNTQPMVNNIMHAPHHQTFIPTTNLQNVPNTISSANVNGGSTLMNENDNMNVPINNSNALKGPSSSSSSSKGPQVDLSLLARIPPPANPADQNPPCNTLYVGNLPVDCTEQELRQLFSTQEGFKRLSFRVKNNNSNNVMLSNSNSAAHGPMCFVEFEDIAYATKALAELYGTQLPRATPSNKGGIRLSFSKNPLGVRGPNNRRNQTQTQMQTQNQNPNNLNSLPGNTASGTTLNHFIYSNKAATSSFTNIHS
ncbi:mRNA-binding protein WHI3 NDAI_0F03530 [Naumovozyma dairenensis CBS 421]|uniref:RRM domain-containing protein n=1 Tax=Naumovozyma dairenensis (strain ATCC 10597 / BCRC 20456 / CBS 421 / NBRC 0211 / NRRL Y-12639) TaxID=1071378 RepID=G0WD10_NAUDC|nr:hypothetical protein NDAI_0F03530 [Naumovozyma dairenensis CBS 421]CCD25671.1 hypothetical protein NDAI_0F03530 [Naumovozyma dairenensis CBS 421]